MFQIYRFLFQLKNIDHTHTVIDKVLEKYSKKGPAGNYCLLQVLSDGGKEEGGNSC